jgi:hypothetical protein
METPMKTPMKTQGSRIIYGALSGLYKGPFWVQVVGPCFEDPSYNSSSDDVFRGVDIEFV